MDSLTKAGESSLGIFVSQEHANKKEAPPGFEPGMVDLQSTALATWPRRHVSIELDSVMSTGKID